MNPLNARLKFLLGVLVLFFSGASSGSIQNGMSAYERRDYARAFAEWAPLARSGNAYAQNNLGVLYEKGQGVTQDFSAAANWYRLSAQQGHSLAQNNLGVLYEKGLGVAMNHAQAAHWYRMSAEQGHGQAQNNLGNLYFSGRGVERDYSQAYKWFVLSAENNVPEALNNLGVLYEKGLAVRQDFYQAANYYLRAASRGLSSAQNNAGVLYEKGLGLPKDIEQAAKLYAVAAEQGHATAQNNLGILYGRGVGVPKDYGIAYAWFILAAQNGDQNAVLNQKILESQLTDAEKKNAQKIVAAYNDKLRKTPNLPNHSAAKEPSVASESPATRKPEMVGSGSGFFVSVNGHVITNAHVVDGCVEVRVGEDSRVAKVLAHDKQNDLAVLQVSKKIINVAKFRGPQGARLGEDILVLGFPLRGILASGLNVGAGNVNALAGLGNNTSLIQISAPVHPGNSGGPVLDRSGLIVGMVVSKINAIRFAKLTGDIPQNINFAINASTVKAFLDSINIPYQIAPLAKQLDMPTLIDQARHYTLPVECWG